MAEDSPAHGDPRPRPTSPARQGSGAETGYVIIGTMLSGMAVWGGAGWLLDQWWDTRVFFPVGVILGVSVAIYLVVARYGAIDPVPGRPPAGRTPGRRRSRPAGARQTQKGRR